VIGLLESESQFYFSDEAVFSSNQLKTKAWYKMRNAKNNKVLKNKLSFVAIAVVAAMNCAGKIVGLAITDRVIGIQEFNYMVDEIA
jgi:hypothetical protein